MTDKLSTGIMYLGAGKFCHGNSSVCDELLGKIGKEFGKYAIINISDPVAFSKLKYVEQNYFGFGLRLK